MTYSSSSPVVTTHHLHHPLLQLTPADPGSLGKWPLKWRDIEIESLSNEWHHLLLQEGW